jgi:hypothetical protein
MLTPSAHEAQACLAKLTPASVPSYALVALTRVYLAVGDDANARAMATRRLADKSVQETGPRAWTLAQFVDAYLDASLPRVAVAKTYLGQLDALQGPEAAVGQVVGYHRLAQYYWRIGDDSSMVAAAGSLIAAGKKLNAHDRQEFLRDILYGYRVMAEAAGARTGTAAEPLKVMAKAHDDIGALPGANKLISNYDSLFALYGKPGARLIANHWISAPGDTVHPVHNKYALIVFGPARNNIPAIRRLAKSYDGQLDVTLVRPTYGYFRALGPLTVQRETEELQKYFVSDLHVSDAISVTYTKFDTIPDGRRIPKPSANDLAYGRTHGAGVAVLDKQGIIRRLLLDWDKSYENRIDETLRQYGARPH